MSKGIDRLKPLRDRGGSDSKKQNAYSYQAKGGSWVHIPSHIDPHSTLKVPKTASVAQCKSAFREQIATPDRQKRVLVSYAAHMLSDGDRYKSDSKRTCDVFDYAVSGDTAKLAASLKSHPAKVTSRDASGRTLLYIAARSGFYDTCELLIKQGAPLTACGSDNSTPLHAASFYGHKVVCLLLIAYGASVKGKNSYGNTHFFL